MEQDIRKIVEEKYSQAISGKVNSNCCSSGGCCGGNDDPITANLYSNEQTGELPDDIVAQSFGCGNPTALAQLNPGEVVLDLGSGAGLDVLLSARRVGPSGKVYGLDMTDEMLAVAKGNQAKAGIENVEFLKGYIEKIPLADNTVDVIISNCVINLSGNKDKVLNEAFRVLKPGGRFAVSDIVLKKSLPEKVQQDLLAWAGCVAGALLETAYRNKLEAAGFSDIDIQVTRDFSLNELDNTQAQLILAELSDAERDQLEGAIVSAFIRAKK